MTGKIFTHQNKDKYVDKTHIFIISIVTNSALLLR